MEMQSLEGIQNANTAPERVHRPPRAAAPETASAKIPGARQPRKIADNVSSESVEDAAQQMNDVLGAFNKNLRFQVNRDTEQMYVQVVNSATQEVVRTIPPEYMMNLMSRVHDILGLIVDERG